MSGDLRYDGFEAARCARLLGPFPCHILLFLVLGLLRILSEVKICVGNKIMSRVYFRRQLVSIPLPTLLSLLSKSCSQLRSYDSIQCLRCGSVVFRKREEIKDLGPGSQNLKL